MSFRVCFNLLNALKNTCKLSFYTYLNDKILRNYLDKWKLFRVHLPPHHPLAAATLQVIYRICIDNIVLLLFWLVCMKDGFVFLVL
jgi:hypothetical protein